MKLRESLTTCFPIAVFFAAIMSLVGLFMERDICETFVASVTFFSIVIPFFYRGEYE